MLLKLGGRHLTPLGDSSAEPFVARLTERSDLPMAARASEILLLDELPGDVPTGFRGVFVRRAAPPRPGCRDLYRLGNEFDYLRDGDVVRVEPARPSLSTLYRRHGRTNSLLVTERCDNYCVMCSQPPKDHDDGYLIDDLLAAIPLMARDTPEIGITGGEPGLLGERLVTLVERLGRCLPDTAVHVLSNGRAFADAPFAKALAAVKHPDLMIGIPLYSDLPEDHDFVVQARGAYDETVRGILNLKRHGVRVELRFVIHRETVSALPAFARFVAKNLLFIDHVALMGLELMGFARANLEAVWIDPLDYQAALDEATMILDRAKMPVSIYNHQLCVLPAHLHRFARASISDWKNEYFGECGQCSRRFECGGFFASSTLRRSRGIHPI